MNLTDFGAVPDGVTDCTPALNAAYARILRDRADFTVAFPPLAPNRWRFASAPDPFGLGVLLQGQGSLQWGGLGTILIADYAEPDPERGFLTWDGAVPFLGPGGGVRDLGVTKGVGRKGGCALKLFAHDPVRRAGQWFAQHASVSCNDTPAGAWDRCLLADGLAAAASGAEGVRDLALEWCCFGGAALMTVELRNAVHVYWHGGIVQQGGGPAPAGLLVTGGAGPWQQSLDLHFGGVSVWGTLAFDRASTFTYQGYASALRITPNASRGLLDVSGLLVPYQQPPGSSVWVRQA